MKSSVEARAEEIGCFARELTGEGMFVKPDDLPVLLKKACQYVAASGKPWVVALKRSPEDAARFVEENLADLDGFWARDRAAASDQAKATLGAHLLLMDLAAMVASDLLVMIDIRAKYKQAILWPGESMPRSDTPRFLLQNLFINFTNMTLATRRAISDGMDLPGKILFRNLTEIGDTTLALVGSLRFFKNYFHHAQFTPGQGYDHWKKHLSPKVVRGIVSSLEGKLGFDTAMCHELHRHRVNRYAWLSGFEHVHPMAMATSAWAFPHDPKAPGRPSLGGVVGPYARALASRVNYFHFEFFSVFFAALGRFHRWSMPSAGVTDDEVTAIADMLHRWDVLRSLSLLVQAVDDRADAEEQRFSSTP